MLGKEYKTIDMRKQGAENRLLKLYDQGWHNTDKDLGWDFKELYREVEKKVYISMIDKFMSGWGYAEGKLNRLVFECDTHEESMIVLNNALSRSDMRNVNYHTEKPYFNNKTNFVQYKNKDMYPNWYVKNYFGGGME